MSPAHTAPPAARPEPTREQVRAWFLRNRNLCRCTGYKPLIDAVMDAAAVLRGEKSIEDLTPKAKTTSIGASAPVGAGKFLAAYAQTKVDGGASRKTASFGYDYFLSKRTDIYAVYMNDKITAKSTGNSFGVGIRHSF